MVQLVPCRSRRFAIRPATTLESRPGNESSCHGTYCAAIRSQTSCAWASSIPCSRRALSHSGRWMRASMVPTRLRVELPRMTLTRSRSSGAARFRPRSASSASATVRPSNWAGSIGRERGGRQAVGEGIELDVGQEGAAAAVGGVRRRGVGVVELLRRPAAGRHLGDQVAAGDDVVPELRRVARPGHQGGDPHDGDRYLARTTVGCHIPPAVARWTPAGSAQQARNERESLRRDRHPVRACLVGAGDNGGALKQVERDLRDACARRARPGSCRPSTG